jgi:hypothetical protein
VLDDVAAHPGTTASEVARRLSVSSVWVGDRIHALRTRGELVGVGGLWFMPGILEAAVGGWIDDLWARHRSAPREVWVHAASVIPWAGKPLDRAVDLLETRGLIRRSRLLVAASGFRPELGAKRQALVDQVAEAVAAASPRFTHPHKLSLELGAPEQAILQGLQLGLDSGVLMRLGVKTVERRTETALLLTSARYLPAPFTLADFMAATSLNRADASLRLDAWDALGHTDRTGDARTFSHQFQQALEDVRLANDDGTH